MIKPHWGLQKVADFPLSGLFKFPGPLLGALLNIEEEIGELRDLLSQRLRLYLSFKYILFPTFSNWGARAKEWLLQENSKGTE
jgi:hypothetical protein